MISKIALHTNNKHRQGYDFSALVKAYPALAAFIIINKYNQQKTIDFSCSDAVRALNSALLKKYYQIQFWDFPKGYLCPPIPGRVDYIHYLADLLKATTNKVNKRISVLDIGTGATCIYPILGAREYGWQFTASDIDPVSIKTAKLNISANKAISKQIECRLQKNSKAIFEEIIKADEFYHLTMCNPPFHNSLAQATQGSNRKWQNLNKSDTSPKKDSLNFGGQKAELWCQGGELAFINKMIQESKKFQSQVLWFSCLVSKKDHVSKLKLKLKKANVAELKVINMAQGNKISRFIAWRFANEL